MKAVLAVVAFFFLGQVAQAVIPVVGGPVDVAREIERVMSAPEVAAALAEAARQREADAYSRKEAEDLARARAVSSRPEARPVRAGPWTTPPFPPPAQADTQVRPVAIPRPTPTNQPQGE